MVKSCFLVRILPQERGQLVPHANARIELGIGARHIRAQLDQIGTALVASKRFANLLCGANLIGFCYLIDNSANRLENIYGRIVTGGARSRDNTM